MYQATTVYFLSKTSDLVLLEMSTAYDTPIQSYLWSVQSAAFAMRERNETSFFYAQMKNALTLAKLFKFLHSRHKQVFRPLYLSTGI